MCAPVIQIWLQCHNMLEKLWQFIFKERPHPEEFLNKLYKTLQLLTIPLHSKNSDKKKKKTLNEVPLHPSLDNTDEDHEKVDVRRKC